MNPQVAFGAPDGWPAYSRLTHGTWELAGVLQDIQPKPRSMNFVLVMFTWRPLDSNPSFHALTRSTHSSREVAMITRSSAKNSSQGTPTLKSLDKDSSTMIKSSGLRTEPWCTPTPTSNSSLYSEPTLTRLRALLYIACYMPLSFVNIAMACSSLPWYFVWNAIIYIISAWKKAEQPINNIIVVATMNTRLKCDICALQQVFVIHSAQRFSITDRFMCYNGYGVSIAIENQNW